MMNTIAQPPASSTVPRPASGKAWPDITITQLKRALAGHAFARGAVFALGMEGTIKEIQSDGLHTQLKSILTTIHTLAESAWTS